MVRRTPSVNIDFWFASGQPAWIKAVREFEAGASSELQRFVDLRLGPHEGVRDASDAYGLQRFMFACCPRVCYKSFHRAGLATALPVVSVSSYMLAPS